MLNTVLGSKDVIMQRQVRLSHVMAHFIVWINTILCIPSLAVGHEAVSTFGILNSASMNIHVQVLVAITALILMEVNLEVELLDCIVTQERQIYCMFHVDETCPESANPKTQSAD